MRRPAWICCRGNNPDISPFGPADGEALLPNFRRGATRRSLCQKVLHPRLKHPVQGLRQKRNMPDCRKAR